MKNYLSILAIFAMFVLLGSCDKNESTITQDNDTTSSKGWSQIASPGDSSNWIQGIFFFDENNGIAVLIDLDVYITSDGGLSWQLDVSHHYGFGYHSNSQILQEHQGTYYYRSGSTVYTSSIKKSEDKGKTWKNIIRDFDFSSWGIRYFQVMNNGDLVTLLDSNLYISQDKGDTWQLKSKIKLSSDKFEFGFGDRVSFTDINTGYQCELNDNSIKILKTFNGGKTWNEISSINHTDNIAYYSIEFYDANHGFLNLYTENNRDAFLVTNDAGKTWNNITHPFFIPISFAYGYNFAFRRDTTILKTELYVSTSLEGNWSRIRTPFDNETQHGKNLVGCHFLNRNYGFVWNRNGKIYKTTTGGN